jgi:hypothetical protein
VGLLLDADAVVVHMVGVGGGGGVRVLCLDVLSRDDVWDHWPLFYNKQK